MTSTQNLLHPAPVSTRQLTWLNEEGEFVGEISSTLGFGQVYADACDLGLTLVSARTGHEIVFVIDHEERDDEGDVQFWILVQASYQRAVSNVRRIRLFND